MTESDYKKLVSEYEKLYEERPDLYYRSFEEYIAYLTRAKEKFLHKGKENKGSLGGFFSSLLKKKPDTAVPITEQDYLTCLKLMDGSESLLKYYLAFQKRDMEMLNNALFETAHIKQMTNISSPGMDHGWYGMNITPEILATNVPERIDKFLKKEYGLSSASQPGPIVANLLMAIRYEDDALKEQAVKKAEAKLKTKLTGYERGLIDSYLALLNHDAAGVNSGLTELCRGFQKSKAFGMTPFTRGFCIEAHAVYNLACQAYDGELLSAVTAPEEPNFCGDLAAYQREHHFAPGRVYNIFPDSLREFNTIMQCDPPDMHLYLRENDRLLDVDRFRTEVVHKLMEM